MSVTGIMVIVGLVVVVGGLGIWIFKTSGADQVPPSPDNPTAPRRRRRGGGRIEG